MLAWCASQSGHGPNGVRKERWLGIMQVNSDDIPPLICFRRLLIQFLIIQFSADDNSND
jgi:hypothetical protein